MVHPAYRLNVPPVQLAGSYAQESLLSIGSSNILAETVKPCEDGGRAFILRLYECEGAYTRTELRVNGAKRITETNLLEDALDTVSAGDTCELSFHPFEIRTLKVEY